MSKIEWCDVTWNPITGCDKVSPGCDNCYALTMAGRLQRMGNPRYQNDGHPVSSGPGFGLTVHRDKFDEPLLWKTPRLVFVNSMSDLFHPALGVATISRIVDTMRVTPQHTYQVLTKRPQHLLAWAEYMEPLPLNVWWGVSVESDRWAWRVERLSRLRERNPGLTLFCSVEPLLGPVPSLNVEALDWVIVGGESGPGARPLNPQWVRDIVAWSVDAGTPVFLKQWGTYWNNPLVSEQGMTVPDARRRDPKSNGKGGAMLDGQLWRQYPTKEVEQ